MKLPEKVQTSLDHTIRHAQQGEGAAAIQKAYDLGRALAELPLSLKEHTGPTPSDAIQAAWKMVEQVNASLIDAGGTAGTLVRKVLFSFDEKVRETGNPFIRSVHDQNMKKARE
jgi:hypothetical protein